MITHKHRFFKITNESFWAYCFNMFTLAVCLIVKDEEEVLKRCLTCAKKFADEIIVVDTGSTDKSKQIASLFTQNVFDFEWNNDFSAARNFSFSKATCDFVMWLDADDFVTNGNIKKINELKKSKNEADVYMLKYAIAFDENNNSTFTYERERILRRSMNPTWEGFVHEAIVPFGKIKHVNITIEHRKIKQTNPKRNLKIYNQRKKETPFSPRELFYYGRELFYNKYYKSCIKTLKKSLKTDLFSTNRIDALKIIAKAYLILGEKEKAKNFLLSIFSFAVPNSEVCCLLGEIEIQEKNFAKAKFWFMCVLNCEKDYSLGAFVEEEYYYFIPYLQLCFVCFKLGDLQSSKQFHEKAKELRPTNSVVEFNEKFFSQL